MASGMPTGRGETQVESDITGDTTFTERVKVFSRSVIARIAVEATCEGQAAEGLDSLSPPGR